MVRRRRTEQLLLVTPHGAIVELSTASRAVGAVDSQDEIAVSPGGEFLAWATPERDQLHVRDAHGKEQIVARYARRMRFSPDGKSLALITDVGRGDWKRLSVLE